MAANEPNHFLVQVSERGSPNVLQNSKYSNNDWQSYRRDKAHGDVKPGDLLLFYFAGGAIDYQKQLRLVYRVSAISEDHKEFSLERHRELNPLGLDQIRNLVKGKQLGESFLNCGRQVSTSVS